MKKRGKIIQSSKTNLFVILLRYVLLLALMFSLPIIYYVLTPLTIYPVFFIFKQIFSNVILSSAVIEGESALIFIINLKTFLQIIPACIAGSAYLLLFILNLSVKMDYKKRFYSLFLSFFLLLLLNIIRIIILGILYYFNIKIFDLSYEIFWYLLSTVFVVFIWFLIIQIFSIKQIPFYSDIIEITRNIKK